MTSTDPLDPLLTAEDLAALARVSVRTIRRWHDLGQIPPGLRIGAVVRWRRDEVEAFLSGAWKPSKAKERK